MEMDVGSRGCGRNLISQSESGICVQVLGGRYNSNNVDIATQRST